MNLKKIAFKIALGLVLYILAIFFFGVATTGGLIWEALGIVGIGFLDFYATKKYETSATDWKLKNDNAEF